MRKDPFFVGSYVHVFNRGNRKLPIVRDEKDKWHFWQMLYYLNDENSHHNPFQYLRKVLKADFNTRLIWPDGWLPRNPIVKIHAVILKDNHYHLLLEEITEGGITKFMMKFGTSMTKYFNTKYNEVGRLFQGPYKAKRIDSDDHLNYLGVYIQVKNALEMYPGGIKKAMKEFDKAYDFAVKYKYSSLVSFLGIKKSTNIDKVIDGDILKTMISDDMDEYKEFAKNIIFVDNSGEVDSSLTKIKLD
jgi:hypothetical protein